MAGCGDTFMELEQELSNQRNPVMNLIMNNDENADDVNMVNHHLKAAYFMEGPHGQADRYFSQDSSMQH